MYKKAKAKNTVKFGIMYRCNNVIMLNNISDLMSFYKVSCQNIFTEIFLAI